MVTGQSFADLEAISHSVNASPSAQLSSCSVTEDNSLKSCIPNAGVQGPAVSLHSCIIPLLLECLVACLQDGISSWHHITCTQHGLGLIDAAAMITEGCGWIASKDAMPGSLQRS